VVEVGDLVVSLAESRGADFIAWHEDFVVKGNTGPANEKKGKLELLAPNLKTILFTLTFAGLGIFKLEHARVEAQGVPTLRASMYCEELTFAAA
jgi:hypothetical protein